MSIAEAPQTNTGAATQMASLDDYIAGLRRRSKPMVWAGGAVFLLALLIALFWPPSYSTTATILIEEQEIPEDMVRSTVTSYATQQIEVIRARVLTLQNIMDLVRKYNLYDEDELARTPRTEIAQDFIDAVQLDLLNAEIIDPRSGRPMEATIAFTLSFEADSPEKTLKVTNELANLFLNENLRTRTAKTSSTADFLREEARKSSVEVQDMEEEIARYKSEHQAALPESFQLNLQNLTRYQTQLIAAEGRLRELTKREGELAASLTNTSKYAPVVLPSGEAVLADVDRLKALQSEYGRVAARYSESHPDVVRLRREIDALLIQLGGAGDYDELQRLLNSRKDELATLRARYSDDHPEVVAAQNLVDQLDAQLASTDRDAPGPAADNPAYLMLDNQLQSVRLEKESLRGQVEQLNEEILELEEAAALAPSVEREYKNLLRNLEVASAKYLDLKAKLKEAELAGELEAGRKGQRFTLIEPPILPEDPSSPNRVAILFLGLVLSLGAGLGIGLLLEALDSSIRSTRRLTDLMGVAPLVTIPYIETPAEAAASAPDRKRYIRLGVVVGVILFALIAFHLFVRPLDVMWFSTLTKLGIG